MAAIFFRLQCFQNDAMQMRFPVSGHGPRVRIDYLASSIQHNKLFPSGTDKYTYMIQSVSRGVSILLSSYNVVLKNRGNVGQ